MTATATLVATPDPQRCTCRFVTTRTRRGHQWVFRRSPGCPVHARSSN